MSQRISVLDRVPRALDNDNDLIDLVQELFRLDRRRASDILGGTTTTAYRRIHEYLAPALDRALEIARRGAEDLQRFRGHILLDLTRSLILIKYQSSRNQISDPLARALTDIISRLQNEIRRGGSPETIQRLIERARVLIDSFAVLAYEYG